MQRIPYNFVKQDVLFFVSLIENRLDQMKIFIPHIALLFFVFLGGPEGTFSMDNSGHNETIHHSQPCDCGKINTTLKTGFETNSCQNCCFLTNHKKEANLPVIPSFNNDNSSEFTRIFKKYLDSKPIIKHNIIFTSFYITKTSFSFLQVILE